MDEIKYLDNVFNEDNYSRYCIRHNTYRNSEPNATSTYVTPVITATIAYIKGTSETIARILQLTLQHPRCSQTYQHFMTATDEH